jgi:hypothetical protein
MRRLMTEAIAGFFKGLDRRPYDPVFGMEGTVRFELKDGDQTDYWIVTAEDGELRVSKETQEDVDAVITTDANLFDHAVRGEVNAISAMLGGLICIRGDLPLFLLIERFLPGPRNAQGPRHLQNRDGEWTHHD